MAINDRTAPASVLEGLKAVDPKADLVYIGPDRWLLGVWAGNEMSRQKASERYRRFLLMPATHREELAAYSEILKLVMRGFRPIDIFELREPDQRVVRDFEERDRNWRVRAQDAFEERLEETEEAVHHLDTRKEIMRDYVHSEFPSVHRFVRGRRSFTAAARRIRSTARRLVRSLTR